MQAPVMCADIGAGHIRSRYLSHLGIHPQPPAKHCAFGLPSARRVSAAEGAGAGGEGGTGSFRVSFLRKLSYEQVWLPRALRPPAHQTIVIFDWDDTLLCTSYLANLHGQSLPPSIQRLLQSIAATGRKLLELSLRAGRTFIVTNAMRKWVESSAETYLPELLPMLQQVGVVSARDRYEEQFPKEVGKWKACAFHDVRSKLDSEAVTNVVSLGDSRYEIEAARAMGKEFARVRIKTVKLQEEPTPRELLRELELLADRFGTIVGTAQDRTVSVQVRPVANAAGVLQCKRSTEEARP